MKSAAITASAAPSVAVTTPPKMPPRMMKGKVSAQAASLNARHSLPHWKISSTGQLFFTAYQWHSPIMVMPAISPGTRPATNSCTTEAPAMTAYRIIGIDGGMMIASEAVDEVTAAVNGPG